MNAVIVRSSSCRTTRASSPSGMANGSAAMPAPADGRIASPWWAVRYPESIA